MNRRLFLNLLASSPLLAQSSGLPVNADHVLTGKDVLKGDANHAVTGQDKASDALMAGMAKASRVRQITTRSYDNLRTGTNNEETILKPDLVRQNGLRQIFSCAVPADSNGMEASPLFEPQVTLQASTGLSTTVDLMLCSTMQNQLYAFDANDGTPYWLTQAGPPILGTVDIDFHLINNYWGILSTGVTANGVWYNVSWQSMDGTAKNGAHYLIYTEIKTGVCTHAIKIPNGGVQRKQRGALTIDSRGFLYIPWSTIQETAHNAHGFITVVDTKTFKIVTEFNTTPSGSGGGIWQAGQGLLCDAQDYLYCMTGNGDQGNGNWSESFLKLYFDGSALKVIDHYSPFDDRNRPGVWDDMDLGSSAPVVIPELQTVYGAGKDSVLYTLPWRKLAAPSALPIWLGFYPGNGVDPSSLANLNKMWFNRSHHQHGTMPVFKMATNPGWRAASWSENGNLRLWQVDIAGFHYLGCSADVASAQSPVPPGGMPGGMLSISTNGGMDAIIWACVPLDDANRRKVKGKLMAFDAINLAKYSDGSGALIKLWESPEFLFNKFNPPVVNNGKVYVTTYDHQVLAFSL